MQNINIISAKFTNLLDNFSPNNFGIFFSLILHLFILLFAIGLPDFFKPKQIVLPNIIPIEILNVAETTSLTKDENIKTNEIKEQKTTKQKKFNSSDNTNLQKIDLKEKPIKNQDNQKNEITLEEKEVNINKLNENTIEKDKKIILKNDNVETFKSKKIKPKLKPKPELKNIVNEKIDNDKIVKPKKNIITKPDQKPQKSQFQEISSIMATVKKDLRNDESVIMEKENENENDKEIFDNENEINDEVSDEIRISIEQAIVQQIHKCWIVNSGQLKEDSEVGQFIKAQAKYKKTGYVIQDSIQILDTNIGNNSVLISGVKFSLYSCKLNLPEEYYDLWKSITINFDHDYMRKKEIKKTNEKLNLIN